ncbi:MAG: dihydrofolate reductase [Muribaculaceae bacterium]|nr:dihydrofolate reductase [Muribaculaceae bacterium]
MSSIEIIVAAGRDGAIGSRGDLAFHIREDLRRFKALTMGYPIVMGRKTWESLPKGALPGRRNIVITTNPDYHAEGAEVVHSLSEALILCAQAEKIFIIGGGQIYAQAMPIAHRLHLTRIDAATPDADTYFPTIDEHWLLTDSQAPATDPSGIIYQFLTLDREVANS